MRQHYMHALYCTSVLYCACECGLHGEPRPPSLHSIQAQTANVCCKDNIRPQIKQICTRTKIEVDDLAYRGSRWKRSRDVSVAEPRWVSGAPRLHSFDHNQSLHSVRHHKGVLNTGRHHGLATCSPEQLFLSSVSHCRPTRCYTPRLCPQGEEHWQPG